MVLLDEANMNLEIARIEKNYIQLDLLFFGLDVKIDISQLSDEFGLYNESRELVKRGFQSHQQAVDYIMEMDYKKI